jgi:hypothetical protein
VASINEEIRERRATLDDCQRAIKRMDTTIEAMQRFLSRVRSRKRYLPDVSDMERLVNWGVAVAEADTGIQMQIQRSQDVFRF